MDYDDQLKIAIMNGLLIFFEVSSIDVICHSVKYQQVCIGIPRILNILTEQQRDDLYLEAQNIMLHAEGLKEIKAKIENLKKHEFANQDAIDIQNKKMVMASANASKSVSQYAPNLLGMLISFCDEYVQKSMDDRYFGEDDGE